MRDVGGAVEKQSHLLSLCSSFPLDGHRSAPLSVGEGRGCAGPGAGPHQGSAAGPSPHPSLCSDPDPLLIYTFPQGLVWAFQGLLQGRFFAMFCLRQPQMPRNVMYFFQLCGK